MAQAEGENVSLEPNFAVLCSFFNKFAVVLGLKPIPFTRLASTMIKHTDDGRVDRELIDLHVKLMKLVGLKSATPAKWLVYLMKFCSFDPSLSNELLQLERFGYAHSSIETKLNILKSLCEKQFDFNAKFKEVLSTSMTTAEMRLVPVGSDCAGLVYWYQQDGELNVRVYSEEPDDLSGGTWTLRASDRDQLAGLIKVLECGKSPTDCSTAEIKVENGEVKEEHQDVKPSTSEDNGQGYEIVQMEEIDQKGLKEIADKPEETKMEITGKLGTFLDTCQATMPEPKVKSAKGRGKAAAVVDVKPEIEATETKVENEEEFTVEKRTLPARSTRSGRALKSPASPQEVAPKAQKPVAKASTPIKKSAPAKSAKKAASDTESSINDDSSAEEENDTSDSEFIPLASLRKRLSGGQSNRRSKKPIESELDSDEDSDGDVAEKKQRKKANEETLCKKCAKSDNWDVLLLCDNCDDAWHTWCLRPPLYYVPDDDWFCPKCMHNMLVEKLQCALAALDVLLVKKGIDDKKKKQAADRMKRELEYIGVSLNNIIDEPKENVKYKDDEEDVTESDEQSDGEESEDEEGRRRSHRKVAKAKRRQDRKEQLPIIPIALGRSRRQQKSVDYNFKQYDDLIEEACDEIQEAPSKPKYYDPVRPQGGVGRGKDMANILKHMEVHERKMSNASKEETPTNGEAKDDEEAPVHEVSRVGQAPSVLTKKPRKRLNDLDVDNQTESETDEYQESGNDSDATVATPSDDDDDDDYISESERVGRRRSTRARKQDKDFVVSGSDSDYKPTQSRAPKKRGGRRARDSSEDTEDSLVEKVKKKRRGYAQSDSESDYSPRGKKQTNAGRYQIRKRKPVTYKWAAKATSSESEDNGEEKSAKKKVDTTTASKKRKRVADSDESEDYKPEESEQEEKQENEDESSKSASDNDDEKPKSKQAPKTTTIPNLARKRQIVSSDDEDESEASGSDDNSKQSTTEKQQQQPPAKAPIKTAPVNPPTAPPPLQKRMRQETNAAAQEQASSAPKTNSGPNSPIVRPQIVRSNDSAHSGHDNSMSNLVEMRAFAPPTLMPSPLVAHPYMLQQQQQFMHQPAFYGGPYGPPQGGAFVPHPSVTQPPFNQYPNGVMNMIPGQYPTMMMPQQQGQSGSSLGSVLSTAMHTHDDVTSL